MGLSPQLTVRSIEAVDPCSSDLGLVTNFDLSSDSWISGELREVTATMHFSPDSEAFAVLTFSSEEQALLHASGILQSESVSLQSGTQSLDMMLHLRALSLPLSASFVAKVMNNTVTHVHVKTSVTVHTSAIWFPMTISHDIVSEFVFNEPKGGPTSPSPKILAIEVDSDASLAEVNKSAAVFAWFTMFLNASSIAMRAPLPDLFVDVFHEGVEIATAHVNPVYVSPIFNMSLDVAVDLNVTDQQTVSIQHLVNYFTSGQNLSIQVQGSGHGGRQIPNPADFPVAPFPLNYTLKRASSVLRTPLLPGGPTCFLQRILDAMPLVTLPISAKLPCPVPTKGTPPANFTANASQVNPIGCTPTEWQGAQIMPSEKESMLQPTRMDLQEVRRNDSSPVYAQAYMEANITMGFSLYGRFSDMFFDLRSAGQDLGYIKIGSFVLGPNQPTWKGNVSWTTVNESLIAQRIIEFKDFNTLNLQLQGRPDENSLSDILFGVNTNITSSASSDNSTNNASQGAAAYIAINDNPVNVSIGMGVQASFLPSFDIEIPQISVGIMNNNITIAEVMSPQARTLQYNATGFLYSDLLQLICNLGMADDTGRFISSLLNDEVMNMTFRGTSTHQQLTTPVVIDFQISFSRGQLVPSSSSSNSGSSAFGLGVEVTKLFRNDSIMTLGWLTNVSWDLPIDVTGVFPQVQVDVKVEPPYNGSIATQTVAGVNMGSFALAGNKASTSLDVNVLNQSLVAKLCLKADAFNLTVSGSSSGNVISRIISQLGFTFTVPRKDGALASTALGAMKKLQPSVDLYDIAIDSTATYLRTSAYLNLSSSSIPINLTVPAMHLALQTAANATAQLQEMSTLDCDSASFSSKATLAAQRKRLGVLQALAPHAPVLGKFLSDVVNFRDVTFAVMSNSSSQVAIEFRYDGFNLETVLDLIATPKPGGWLSIPGLRCNDTARTQSQWVWANSNDQWIVSCPAACGSPVMSIGAGLYDWTSSVCTAAQLEGALSSCGGKVLVTIETSTSFSIDKYVSNSLWPLKSLEPLTVLRNLSSFQAKAGAVIASLGIPLAGNLPEVQVAVSQNSSEMLRAQIGSFVIPAINTDLNLTLSTTVLQQQPLIDLISNAKTDGVNLTISGVGGSHVLNSIASFISYKLSLSPVNTSALSLFPSIWPLITFDIDSDNTTANVAVSTEFTPDFNAGFDLYVGAFTASLSIGQLERFADVWTPTGTIQLSELMLRDNACSKLNASVTLRVPSGSTSFLTSMMQQYFHGYALNSSFQGSLNSRNFGPQTLSVNVSLPAPVSANPPAETDHRCLCEPVWEDQGHLFFGECARTVTYPNGYCKIQNGSCFLTPSNPSYDACTQQSTRTYYGCECQPTWSYNTTQYTDGGCHNPDNSPQAWCPVIPGSCFGDSFTSAYKRTDNFYLSSADVRMCGTFYSQARTEAICDADPACLGYSYAPLNPSRWCLIYSSGVPQIDYSSTLFEKLTGRVNFRTRDVCSNPNVESAKSSVVLNSVHLLGSGTSNKVLLPCLLPGTFCPFESAGLNASSLQIMVNFSLTMGIPLQVNLHSNLDVVLQGYGLTPLFSVKVRALNFSSETFVNLVVLITPLDLPLSQTIVKDITHGKNNVDIGIAGNTGPGVAVLSSMFSRIGMKITFFKYAVDSNGFIADADKSYNFSYWLSGTTTDSATVSVATPLKNPVNVTWNLGQVSIRAWYALQSGNKPPVVVATSSFPFNLSPGLNNLLISATIVSEPSLNVCAGYPRTVSPPTFCAANEILSRVLSKTSTAGIPLRLEINTTNIFGQTITVEVDLALLSVDNTPTRSKVLTPSTIYLIEGYSFNFLSTAWSSLSSASITIDMNIVLHNPFNVTIKATELGLTLSLKDWEGGKIDNSAVAAVLGGQTVPPVESLFLLNHNYVNSGGVTVGYLGSQSVAVNGIQVSGMSSDLAVHFYDNYMEKDRACVHVTNGILKFSVKGPTSPNALTITQFFDRGNISAVGWSACDGPQTCTSTQYISTWNISQWSSSMGLSGSAVIDVAGLRLTTGSQQLGSGFRLQKVLLADNWETTFKIFWDYGGFTATGIGEGISMIFHDMPAGSAFLNNGYYGYYGNNPRSFALIFVADHIRGCAVNCEEEMRFVRNGVAVPNSPTGEDPSRSQFVWGPGSWTQITVKYNYDTKFMYVYVGSQLYLVWTVDVMNSGFADANGQGWVGFAARTANFYQGTFRMIDWSWTRYKVAQDNIRIDGGNGLRVGYAGPQAIMFNLDTRDSCNYAVYSNMQSATPLLVLLTGRGAITGVSVNASSLTPVPAFPGLLQVVVFASQAGIYDVHVKCNDVACAGSSGYSVIGYLEIAPSF